MYQGCPLTPSPPPQEIGTIVSLIKDVADQTEVLARRLLIVWPQGEAPRGALAVTAVRGLRTLQPAPDQGHDAPPKLPDPALIAAWARHEGAAIGLFDPAAFFA